MSALDDAPPADPGANVPASHRPKDDGPPPPGTLRTKPCRHYEQGRCSWGSSCRFLHAPQPRPTPSAVHVRDQHPADQPHPAQRPRRPIPADGQPAGFPQGRPVANGDNQHEGGRAGDPPAAVQYRSTAQRRTPPQHEHGHHAAPEPRGPRRDPQQQQQHGRFSPVDQQRGGTAYSGAGANTAARDAQTAPPAYQPPDHLARQRPAATAARDAQRPSPLAAAAPQAPSPTSNHNPPQAALRPAGPNSSATSPPRSPYAPQQHHAPQQHQQLPTRGEHHHWHRDPPKQPDASSADFHRGGPPSPSVLGGCDAAGGAPALHNAPAAAGPHQAAVAGSSDPLVQLFSIEDRGWQRGGQFVSPHHNNRFGGPAPYPLDEASSDTIGRQGRGHPSSYPTSPPVLGGSTHNVSVRVGGSADASAATPHFAGMAPAPSPHSTPMQGMAGSSFAGSTSGNHSTNRFTHNPYAQQPIATKSTPVSCNASPLVYTATGPPPAAPGAPCAEPMQLPGPLRPLSLARRP